MVKKTLTYSLLGKINAKPLNSKYIKNFEDVKKYIKTTNGYFFNIPNKKYKIWSNWFFDGPKFYDMVNDMGIYFDETTKERYTSNTTKYNIELNKLESYIYRNTSNFIYERIFKSISNLKNEWNTKTSERENKALIFFNELNSLEQLLRDNL